jgi:hypothetical protein
MLLVFVLRVFHALNRLVLKSNASPRPPAAAPNGVASRRHSRNSYTADSKVQALLDFSSALYSLVLRQSRFSCRVSERSGLPNIFLLDDRPWKLNQLIRYDIYIRVQGLLPLITRTKDFLKGIFFVFIDC